MEAGVPGRMEPAVRPVVVEHREEPDPVTIQDQAMVERFVLDLVLQQDNVIQSPVQVGAGLVGWNLAADVIM